MSETTLPATHVHIERRIEQGDEVVLYETLDGEVPMAQEEQDRHRQYLGDGNGHVTVSTEFSYKEYGTGCNAFVSVSLTHHQGEQYALLTGRLASETSIKLAEEHLRACQQKCIQLGLLKAQQ